MKINFLQNILLLWNLKKREHLAKFLDSTSLNANLLGNVLGFGGQHIIYAYGKKHVIKVANSDLIHYIFGIHSIKEIKTEDKLLRKYFLNQYLKVKVFESKEYPYYAIYQPRINKIRHTDTKLIKKHRTNFLKLLKQNRKMEKEKGYFLDLFGRHGLIQTFVYFLKTGKVQIFLHNILFHKNQFLIIDTNLLRVSKKSEKNIIKLIRFKLLKYIYKKLIKKALK